MKSIVFQLSVPPDTPPDDALFLAGNFNDWIPDDERFRFEPTADGRYRLQFIPETPLKAGLACKVTRGKWSTAECAPTGRPMSNRRMDATSENTVHELKVNAWMDRMPKRASSAEIHVLHTDGHAVLLTGK